MTTRKYKVAHLVSHPIQYAAPLFRSITLESQIDLTVFYLSDFSVRGYKDTGFGATVEWDVPLLEGYKHVFLPSVGRKDKISQLWPLTYGIRNELAKGKFDALWLHGYAHHANIRALIAAKSLGIKVFVRSESQLSSQLGSRVTRRLKDPIIRAIFRQMDGFLSIGSLNSEFYKRFGAAQNKIFNVPYAVDNEFFQRMCSDAAPRREKLRASLALEPNRPVILFASKFIARKRAVDLLEAYIRLSEDGSSEPYPYLLFVGSGEEQESLESRAAQTGWSSIKFLGFKNQTELPAFFDLCDVFVLASEAEPWGLIVNEVMNAGRAIIVTDQVGAAPDLVIDNENGYVVPARDVGTLSDRLKTVTSNPNIAKRMGESSLRRIQEWDFGRDIAGIEASLIATVGLK